jgi:glycosyltransferase involved in cell wall biosynthesis
MDTTVGQHDKYPEYFERRKAVESKRSFLEVQDEASPADVAATSAAAGGDAGISVVLGVYNHAPILRETLPVFAEVCRAYGGGAELIVCDDGSTDSTREIVEQFAAEPADKLRIVYLGQDNIGRPRLAANVNQCLSEVTKPYALFVMGDSYPRQDLLDRYAPHLAPDAILSGLREQVAEVFAQESTPDYRKAERAFRNIATSTRPWEGFTGNNFVIPTDMLKRIGGWNPGFEGYGAEDWELAAYAYYAEHARFVPVPDAVVYHVSHPVREGSGDTGYYLAKWFEQLAARYAAGDFDRSTDELQPKE